MSHLIFLGSLLLVGAWLLHRGGRKRAESARRDLPAEVRSEMLRNAASDAGRLREMEIRLHDYGRELEARMQTRLAVLDRLLREADREIVRLTRLLERRQNELLPSERNEEQRHEPHRSVRLADPDILVLPQPAAAARRSTNGKSRDGNDPVPRQIATGSAAKTSLTAEQWSMLRHLANAGYVPAELATLVGLPLAEIESALREERREAA